MERASPPPHLEVSRQGWSVGAARGTGEGRRESDAEPVVGTAGGEVTGLRGV